MLAITLSLSEFIFAGVCYSVGRNRLCEMIETSEASLRPKCKMLVPRVGLASALDTEADMTIQGAKQKMMDDILSAKRLAEEQLRLLELQERRLQMGPNADDSIDTITNRINRVSLNGPVSEPTTPPEYADGVYASRYSRGSRMSTSSIMSPPGLGKRFSQASAHNGLISPSASRLSGSLYTQAQQSAKSVPASRRGSDEEEDYADALPNIRQPAV
jgi:hypothetical protein